MSQKQNTKTKGVGVFLKRYSVKPCIQSSVPQEKRKKGKGKRKVVDYAVSMRRTFGSILVPSKTEKKM
jgi:hypothetical protein